jgi:hypothetical protein
MLIGLHWRRGAWKVDHERSNRTYVSVEMRAAEWRAGLQPRNGMPR